MHDPADVPSDLLRHRLSEARSLMNYCLKALNRDHRTDAVEAIYTLSCLIEQLDQVLDDGAPDRLIGRPESHIVH